MPVNKTATMRPLAWAKFMNQYGYKPIIITRNWDRTITTEDDVHFPSGKRIKHEIKDGYEVYYVPFKGTIEHRLINHIGRIKGASWLFSKIQKTFGHFFIFHPYRNFYKFARKYIEKENIDFVIVTVPPFDLLKIGYKLNKATGVKWIADYRDEWHTSEIKTIISKGYSGFIGKIKQLFSPDTIENEKNWLKSSSCFTTVTPLGVSRMSKFLNIPGNYIPNGFFKNEFDTVEPVQLFDVFTITYAGWLYESQQIEVLIQAIKNLHKKDRLIKVRLLFVGGNSFRGMSDRISKLSVGIEHLVEMTDRVSRKDSIAIQKRSHLLLLCSHVDSKSIPSSKLYEYIALRKPVLVCPGDFGIINETIEKMQNGFICRSVEEAESSLSSIMNEISEKGIINISFNENLRDSFSRENQTKSICEVLDSI